FENGVFFHRIPETVLIYMKIVLWSEAVGIMLVRLHWCPAAILDLIPAGAMIPLVFLFRKSYPSRWESADFFDRLFNRKSLVVNALEITERQAPETEFSAYAIELALSALKSWRGKIPLKNPMRKRDVIPALAVAAALLCPLPHPNMTGPEGRSILQSASVERKDSGSRPNRTIRRDPELRPENVRRNEEAGLSRQNDFGSGHGAGRSHGAGKTEEKMQNGGQNRADGNFEGKDSGMKESGTPHRQERDAGKNPRETENRPAGGGMNGSSGINGEEESGSAAGMTAGHGGGSMFQTPEKRRRKEVNHKKTEHRGGFQPLLPDRSPQAGRKAAEGDEHGDSPGTGRGGDTGTKKSRGAAASLPVLPRPDTVTGRLGEGEDMTSIDRSHSGSNTLPGRFGNSSGSAETAAPHYAVSALLRRKIRGETEKLMGSKEKDK
ncbi:MAG: hypothetical protein IJH79_00215, partial [Lentisphaeria bacterium]|nr:hypothetical protein [Lentisphaeria bacterium]